MIMQTTHTSKLAPEQALEVRRLYAEGGHSQDKLAPQRWKGRKMSDPKLLAAADGVCISLLARRAAQIRGGYDAAHDDEHRDGAIVTNAEWGVTARLRKAADCESTDDPVRREHLVVAASLLVAEIERIDRARERLLAAKEVKP